MTPLPLHLEPEAEADLQEAYVWYEKQRTGLGQEFIECAEELFEMISRQPLLYAITYRNVRQALVKRFPYVVCFIKEEERLDVVAVFHGHRDPHSWKARVK